MIKRYIEVKDSGEGYYMIGRLTETDLEVDDFSIHIGCDGELKFMSYEMCYLSLATRTLIELANIAQRVANANYYLIERKERI